MNKRQIKKKQKNALIRKDFIKKHAIILPSTKKLQDELLQEMEKYYNERHYNQFKDLKRKYFGLYPREPRPKFFIMHTDAIPQLKSY